ncbi:MAG TPA: GDSL-type esterase/lipase family protein, partial [Blastocatellia bacterium]|nr:GDSL-type esterase/lipase family protein [Blastocatellia bacterium]
MSVRLRITCIFALCASTSFTALAFFAGIAAACEGTGGGGGGCATPTASTGEATSITSNSATLNGSVNAQGCITYYIFEWGASSESGYPNSAEGSAGNETSPKAVSTNLPAGMLQPSTEYKFRLSAINSEGKEATGSAVPFKTAPACTKPTVTTESASFITSDKAFLNGKVNPNGCEASYTFEYGLVGSGTYTKLPTGTVGVLGPFSVSKEATGLQAKKLYNFRLVATNSKGTTEGSYLNFETKPKYVALGDSYSAGTGTGTNYEPNNTGSCHRTVKAYPYLLHNAHPDWGFVNASCHGAVTSDLINSQAKSLTQDTTWVTYTIGGNDAGFKEVIEECLWPETEGCFAKIATAQSFIQTKLPTLLDNVNNKIKAEAPYAKVIVLDYPRVFNGEDCNTFTWFDPEEMKRLNETSEKLRDVISAATAKAGGNFVPRDVIPGFKDHAVCDPPGSGEWAEWING